MLLKQRNQLIMILKEKRIQKHGASTAPTPVISVVVEGNNEETHVFREAIKRLPGPVLHSHSDLVVPGDA